MENAAGVIVPYTDAMHLGRGFNSYTLEPCLDDCVRGSQTHSDGNTVNYRIIIADKLSDVASALNIPFYPSIKRESISFNDAVSAIDEEEFYSADVNFIVIINVETRRLSITVEEGGLRLRDGVQLGNLLFNEIYGDSYVSQYIAGGTAAAVLSISVLDRTRAEETIKTIKESLKLNDHEASAKLMLDAYGKDKSNAFATALKGTKTHACVSCIGNGNLINDDSIDKVLASVLDFPNTVSTKSAWTWAKLTRYHMDSSLISSLGSSEYATLKYDQIEGFSAELLDKFMGFKALLRDLKAIIADRDNFEPCKNDNNPIEVSLEVLLSTQRKLRQDMLKIIQAIGILSQDPWSHKRQMARKQCQGPQPANDLAVVARPAAAGPNATDLSDEPSADLTVGGGAEQLTFDFGSLLSPDVWKRSMPIRKSTVAPDANSTARVSQSSEAMARGHRQRMDAALVTHNNVVQKMEGDSKRMLSEKEIEYTNKMNNLDQSLTNTKSDLKNVKLQLAEAEKKIKFFEGPNNLDPAYHGMKVLICLRVSPYTALDFAGIPHGWSLGFDNPNQHCYLEKVRPGEQNSPWLIHWNDKYMELGNPDNGTPIEYAQRRYDGGAHWQEWMIGRTNEQEYSLRIYHPSWNVYLDMAEPRENKSPKDLRGWSKGPNSVRQLFQIHVL
ncbi:hypothetical protein F5884DRAFT_899651 [Xylogone sp. PMI_703]|nr:hypothetical protein F5884DRAFT_899651 [Xylogone sp. PMI_703]